MASSSKKPCCPPLQGKKIKFLINIPLNVSSEDNVENRCKYLLDALQHESFDSKETNGKLDDIVVVFGLNGKHSESVKRILDNLKKIHPEHKVKHSEIKFTWGSPQAEIPWTSDAVPYQKIRNYLKDHPVTIQLVSDLRKNDPECLIYFSFVDSDTMRFNYIYSAYLEIVKEEVSKDSTVPTVMSTGYEFHSGSEFHIASWLDRMARVATAEVYPLGTYYPEPNFCVLVRPEKSHLTESFIDNRRKNLESAVLITNLYRERLNVKAVFSDKNPIIIDIPSRFKLHSRGLETNQSHLSKRTWAIGINLHVRLQSNERFRGSVGKNRKFLTNLLKCKFEQEFTEMSKSMPFSGEMADLVIEAAKAVKEYMKVIYDLEERMV